MQNRSRASLFSGLAASVILATTLTGCGSSEKQEKVVTSEDIFREVMKDPTPQLATLAEREVDLDIATRLARNINGRMLREEFRRLGLVDRPSHLSREPISSR
ncbi:MAG: hypothetical protein AAF108_11830 [Planctomycetota bacterium]